MKKFTDRFLELPQIYLDSIGDDDDDEDLISIQSVIKLNIYNISHYAPYSQRSLKVSEGTEVFMKDGESYYIPMPLEKFEEEINFYHAILCRD